MKNFKSLIFLLLIVCCAVLLTSCYTEDPGDLQEMEEQYSITDFDRLEMGSAFKITVTQGELFSVGAKGDKRNLDDLRVRKDGTKLLIDFDDNHNRKHDTYINITMPSVRSLNFSGASDSHVTGFSDGAVLDFNLSGASSAQVDNINATAMNLKISGASNLKFTGDTKSLYAELSGASVLNAFNLYVEDAHVYVSGASEAKVNVSTTLYASASGASTIKYRGSPAVTKTASGSSTVKQD